MSKNIIKIAQISDSHLLDHKAKTIHEINPYTRLSNVIRYINKKKYDLILFTGDIANDGSKKSYIQFQKLIKKLDDQIIIVPGNHDDIDNLIKIIPQSKKLIIAPRKEIKIKNWYFLYIDTVVKNKNHGFFSKKCINNLKINLMKKCGAPICVIMHHHPFDIGLPMIDQYKIQNTENFSRQLTRDVKLVIHGHIHSDYTIVKNRIYTSCPATCFQYMKNIKVNTELYGFKEYTLEKDKIFFNCIWFTDNGIKNA